jgi:hypothetical protein
MIIFRISYPVFRYHHSNLVCQSPLGFGNEIKVYHSNLVYHLRGVPLGFGI